MTLARITRFCGLIFIAVWLTAGPPAMAQQAPGSSTALAKLSPELQALAQSTGTVPANVTWGQFANGQVLVKVLINAASPDPELVSLRSDVIRNGGSVFYNFLSVRALAAMVPASALLPLAGRSDVIGISANRAVQRHDSLVQATSNAGSALPGAGTASALDGRGVGIAVLDSGIDFRHRNFASANGSSRVRAAVDIVALGRTLFGDGWTAGYDYSPTLRAGMDGTTYRAGASAPISLVPDPYGHGTAVASAAAGSGSYQSPDSSGIAPGADLYDVRVLDETGVGTTADVLAGIDWVLQRARLAHIRVMNLSLGGTSTDSVLVDPLARAARSAVAAGIVVVASAGNVGKDANGNPVYGSITSPGDEASVITVGADNMFGTPDRSDDAVSSYSSRGPTGGAFTFANGDRWNDNFIKPDLVAPGSRVITAMAQDITGLPSGWCVLARTYPQLTQVPGASQAPHQGLMYLGGTSMAAPAVAGAAAVLLQANPGLTPPLVKAILQYTATPLANANLLQQGTGLLNVEGAVRLARALRPDIATALEAGSIKPADSLLAAGAALPAPVTTLGGQSMRWSQLAYAGATHLVGGDALFASFQPIWDPGLTWARDYVLRDTVTYYPASRWARIPPDTVPRAIVETNAEPQPLLTAGVRLLDAVAVSIPQGAAALMTPVTTLAARAQSGMGLTLGVGFAFTGSAIQADGFVLTQGFLLNEGLLPSEGSVSGQGFLLNEGFILNEGFLLNEAYVQSQGFILNEGFLLNEGFMLNESAGDSFPGD